MTTFLTGFNTVGLYVWLAVTLAVVGAGVFALIHALRAPADAFVAAGKWQRNYWLITLGLATLLALALPRLGLIIGAIAILVYLLDARPKLDEVRRPRY